MVPLENVLAKPAAPTRERFLPPRREQPPKPEAAPAPPKPHRFRVTDVLSRRTLADDASARETIDLLKRIRSVVDVTIDVFEPEEERWRLLTLREQRALWALRDR